MADSTGRYTSLYDAAGQTTAVRSPNSQSVTFTYTAAGQRRSMEATNSGRTTYTYDLTGNQRIEQPPAGNRTTTTWNYENQPTQYRLPTGLPVTMAYNGDNRRISLVQGTSTTKFVWDPVIDAYIQELDGSNVLVATYTSEPQQYGGVLSQRRGSTSSFLHADALGTTRLLTSTAGATTDTYLLDAWGNPVSSTGSTVNPFRWVGRYGYYTDNATGLIYVRARMYQPTIARWVSVDPQFLILTLDLYQYSENDPSTSNDPSGFEICVCRSGRYGTGGGNGGAGGTSEVEVFSDGKEACLSKNYSIHTGHGGSYRNCTVYHGVLSNMCDEVKGCDQCDHEACFRSLLSIVKRIEENPGASPLRNTFFSRYVLNLDSQCLTWVKNYLEPRLRDPADPGSCVAEYIRIIDVPTLGGPEHAIAVVVVGCGNDKTCFGVDNGALGGVDHIFQIPGTTNLSNELRSMRQAISRRIDRALNFAAL